MENIKGAPKFKFSSQPKVKKEETELKAKENFSIDELKKYYLEFMNLYNKIEEELKEFDRKIEEKVLSKDELKGQLETISQNIKDIKENYKNNASFLVGYDKQNYLSLLDDLTKLFEEKKEKLNPKKKFTFSNKTQVTKQEDKEVVIDTTKDHKDEEFEFILKDKKDAEIKINKDEVESKNNLIIENISNCKIYILHSFKACYIKNVIKSQIFIGSVAGGSHITDCFDSEIYLTTHQLRIHTTHNTQFKIIAASNPIIENCSGLVFSPLNINYSTYKDNLEKVKIDLTKNKWNGVLDFKWHKKEKSPNFDCKEESEMLNLYY